MKNYFRALTLAVFTAFSALTLVSCGGGGGGGTDDSITVGSIGTLSYQPDSCSESDQIKFVYDVMHDVYLWSEETPELDYSSYSSQSELLADLRYTLDQWSYISDQETYNDYYAGDGVGLGIRLLTDYTSDIIYVALVYPDSPADEAGLKRGWRLTEVNGYTAQEIIDGDLWDEAFGANEAGLTADIRYIDSDGAADSVTIVKDEYYTHSAPAYALFDNGSNGRKIGYLHYLAFTSNYYYDTYDAFSEFYTEDVSELIIDLRYNSGGLNTAARYLASTIAGPGLAGGIMYQYLHNSKYSEWDRAVTLSSVLINLDIERVVFIVTPQSASASELVINTLSPYMDVYTVGGTTAGKPAGMYAFPYCTSYIVPISFEVVNSLGQGGYFDGLEPDCESADDVSAQLGSADERMLAAALNYLETGTCTDSRRTLPQLLPERTTGTAFFPSNR